MGKSDDDVNSGSGGATAARQRARGTLGSRPTDAERGTAYDPFLIEKYLDDKAWYETIIRELPPVHTEVIDGPEGAKMRETKTTIQNILKPYQTLKNWVLAIGMMETRDLSASYKFGDVWPPPEGNIDLREMLDNLRYQPLRTDVSIAPQMFSDTLPVGHKTDDAANFGLYKMNWYMIKQCPRAQQVIQRVRSEKTDLKKDGEIQEAVGKEINKDVVLATEILLDAMTIWSTAEPDPANRTPNNFWAGHRMGETGLRNLPPNWFGKRDKLRDSYWLDILGYYKAVKAIKITCDQHPNIWHNNRRYYSYVPAI